MPMHRSSTIEDLLEKGKRKHDYALELQRKNYGTRADLALDLLSRTIITSVPSNVEYESIHVEESNESRNTSDNDIEKPLSPDESSDEASISTFDPSEDFTEQNAAATPFGGDHEDGLFDHGSDDDVPGLLGMLVRARSHW